MHYYQFNIGDYASHTRHLSPIEDIAYRRLLDNYYLSERPFNSNVTTVARQIGLKEYEQEVEQVLNEFFELIGDGWIHHRAEKEISNYKSKIDNASKAGKASAEKRFNARSTDVQLTNNHKPLTINQEPLTNINTIQAGNKFPPCPSQQILKLWKKHLPHLTQPRTWEGSRQSNLKNRWIQASKHSDYSDGYTNLEEGIHWWDSFFEYIAKDTKLASGFESKDRTWKPDLEWVVNASNFQKIIDGKYNK